MNFVLIVRFGQEARFSHLLPFVSMQNSTLAESHNVIEFFVVKFSHKITPEFCD